MYLKSVIKGTVFRGNKDLNLNPHSALHYLFDLGQVTTSLRLHFFFARKMGKIHISLKVVVRISKEI